MSAAIHVVRSGDPSVATVVFVHGAMDRSSSFGRVARQLVDLRLVRYDRRGYGRSLAAGTAMLDDHVADLFEVLDGEATPVVVFGHSFGGVVALTAASRRPDRIGCVVAYESPTPWEPWWPPRGGGPSAEGGAASAASTPADEAEAFMRRAIGDRIWDRLPARSRADRRAEGRSLLADLASLEGPAPYAAERLSVPVIAACGGETSWWHRRAAEDLADRAPLGELLVIGGASHGVHLSHPTATADLVRRGIERAEVASAQR